MISSDTLNTDRNISKHIIGTPLTDGSNDEQIAFTLTEYVLLNNEW